MRQNPSKAVRLRIASDLHAEKLHDGWSHKAMRDLVRDPEMRHAAVMAGDLAFAADSASVARDIYPNACAIILVPGNHEGYGCREGWDAAVSLMREGASHLPGVHVLHDDVLDLPLPCGASEVTVRFVGTTLWTDYELFGNARSAMEACNLRLNDVRCIGGADNAPRHDAAAARERHLRSRAWMREILAATPEDIPLVAVTHHLPSRRSVHPKWRKYAGTPGFASNADELLGRAHLFVHGHTHDSHLWRHRAAAGERPTLVVCNPLGYARSEWENNHFDPRLDVTLRHVVPRDGTPADWKAERAKPFGA